MTASIMRRRRFRSVVGGGLERGGEALAQHGELGLDGALALLLAGQFVAEGLQRHLQVRDSDFKFGQ